VSQPATQTESRSAFRKSAPLPVILRVLAACIVPTLYFVYIAHYAVNSMFWDEWTFMPMVNAALHGHLTLGTLWAQYNEERLLVPKLLWIMFANTSDLNTKTIMFFNAGLLTGAYVCLLVSYRSVNGKWPGVLTTLALGLVWFSIADWENALWAFQLAWYLILFLFVLMLLLLSRCRMSPIVLTAAMASAVAASFSGLQGLFLWPLGLICILWRDKDVRWKLRYGLPWVVVAGVTTATYFWNYQFHPSSIGGGSIPYGLRHPFGMVKYFFAAMGNLFPNDNPSTLVLHEALGVGLFVVAVSVVVASVRSRIRANDPSTIPLATSLILFAVLFDLSIALGRLSLGMGAALSSRYTMANLLLAAGIVLYASDCIAKLWSTRRPAGGRLPSRKVWLSLATAVLLAVLAIQVVASTRFGISNSSASRSSRIVAARIVVNYSSLPVDQREPLVTTYVYPLFPVWGEVLRFAEQDRLAELAPGPRHHYQKLGPP
jgi:hypothetical protein